MTGTLKTRSVLAASLLAVLGSATAADKVTILSEGGASPYWRAIPETIAMPAYPGIVADKSEDVCIGVGYMLDSDGSTGEFAVLNAWGSKTAQAKPTDAHFLPFSQNALAAVQRWKFATTGGGSAKVKPIYTAATFAFSTTQGGDIGAVRGHCTIADLADFIARVQAEAYRRRGNLNKGVLDRNRTQYAPVIPLK